MRAEPLLSRHRQKPWASFAEMFEVKDLISHADGELSSPFDLVSMGFTGVKRKMPNILASWLAFFGGKGTKKGRSFLSIQELLVGEM